MRSAAHGFTLIEVLIAGGLAGLIAVAAFAAVTNMQQASGTQIEATTTFSSGTPRSRMSWRSPSQMVATASAASSSSSIVALGPRFSSTARWLLP